MKYLRIYLVLALILSCCLVATAQDKEGAKKETKHRGNITKEYDKASDKTTLSLGLMPITCVKDACLFFSLRSTFDGTELKVSSNRFIFGLYIFTKTLEPFADPTLSLRVGDELLEVGAMTFAGKRSNDDLDGLAYGITLYGDEVRKIANAHKVGISIGGLQFDLDENEINAINDLYLQATTTK